LLLVLRLRLPVMLLLCARLLVGVSLLLVRILLRVLPVRRLPT
jgi:hypothetical protein